MAEVLQQTESNLVFYLDGKLQVNDVQTLNKWTNDLLEDEWNMVKVGNKTMKQARQMVSKILEMEHKYWLQLMSGKGEQ